MPLIRRGRKINWSTAAELLSLVRLYIIFFGFPKAQKYILRL